MYSWGNINLAWFVDWISLSQIRNVLQRGLFSVKLCIVFGLSFKIRIYMIIGKDFGCVNILDICIYFKLEACKVKCFKPLCLDSPQFFVDFDILWSSLIKQLFTWYIWLRITWTSKIKFLIWHFYYDVTTIYFGKIVSEQDFEMKSKNFLNKETFFANVG